MPIEDIIKQKISSIVNRTFIGMQVPDYGPKNFGSIPDLLISISEYTLKLAGGKVTSGSAQLTSFEGTEGRYACHMDVTNVTISFSHWHEEYYLYVPESYPAHFAQTFSDFYFVVQKFSIDMKLVINGSNVDVSLTAVPNGLNIHVPERSALTGHILPCVQKEIDNRLEKAISEYDFATPIKKAVEELLKI